MELNKDTGNDITGENGHKTINNGFAPTARQRKDILKLIFKACKRDVEVRR